MPGCEKIRDQSEICSVNDMNNIFEYLIPQSVYSHVRGFVDPLSLWTDVCNTPLSIELAFIPVNITIEQKKLEDEIDCGLVIITFDGIVSDLNLGIYSTKKLANDFAGAYIVYEKTGYCPAYLCTIYKRFAVPFYIFLGEAA